MDIEQFISPNGEIDSEALVAYIETNHAPLMGMVRAYVLCRGGSVAAWDSLWTHLHEMYWAGDSGYFSAPFEAGELEHGAQFLSTIEEIFKRLGRLT